MVSTRVGKDVKSVDLTSLWLVWNAMTLDFDSVPCTHGACWAGAGGISVGDAAG
jgi:hypothetical protein